MHALVVIPANVSIACYIGFIIIFVILELTVSSNNFVATAVQTIPRKLPVSENSATWRCVYL